MNSYLSIYSSVLQTGYATANYRMTFNQHSVYISLPAFTTHANEPQDLRGYWIKFHQIFSHRNYFIDYVNATIYVVIRPTVVH